MIWRLNFQTQSICFKYLPIISIREHHVPLAQGKGKSWNSLLAAACPALRSKSQNTQNQKKQRSHHFGSEFLSASLLFVVRSLKQFMEQIRSFDAMSEQPPMIINDRAMTAGAKRNLLACTGGSRLWDSVRTTEEPVQNFAHLVFYRVV